MISQEELNNRFNFHPAGTKERQDAHKRIRSYLLQMATEFNESLPDSDETEEAIRKLEEAMFWANASLARQDKN